jgi:choline dehydrogenase-like flavoprotein
MINTIIGEEVGRVSMGRVKVYDYLQDEKDESWPSFTGGGWHHHGHNAHERRCKTGVVNANCKVHSINNLYTAGASCLCNCKRCKSYTYINCNDY